MAGSRPPHFHSLTPASSVRRAHGQPGHLPKGLKGWKTQKGSRDGKAACKLTAALPDSNFSVSNALKRRESYRLPEINMNGLRL